MIKSFLPDKLKIPLFIKVFSIQKILRMQLVWLILYLFAITLWWLALNYWTIFDIKF
ncbi:hypothetical protein [Spiroplasma endosymbiont of Acasis viretata]|uniref:hypothetical protein n=1 Tax=Spiroplasma endosymbiont of Acasis viretata TaxID=3066306 RepID=UPI00313BAE77